MSHSKGTWNSYPHRALITDGDGADIAMVNIRLPEAAANARLIASAPELLEVLEKLARNFETYDKNGDWGHEYMIIQGAIRKAKGEL